MAVKSHPEVRIAGTVKPRLRGIRSLLTHRTFRRVVQIGFAAFILYTIIYHLAVGEDSGIITASAEAYCPFGGIETLYKYITSGGSTVSHTHLSNLVVFAAVVISAVLFRSAFCGWICPLGFLQEIVSGFSSFVQKKVLPVRRAVRWLKKRLAFLAVADRYLRLLKYGVLVWSVGGAAIFGFMVFRDYDPWAALLNLAEASFTAGTVVLIVMLVASLFVERPWCRYACPLGAVSGILGKLSPVYLKRNQEACTVCKVCSKSCPMGLPVHTAQTIKSLDCIGCLECVGSCPRDGALEVRVGIPLIGK